MNLTKADILDKLLSKKGNIVTLIGQRPMKTYKDITHQILKQSTFQARVGVDYDSTAVVIGKRLSGELPAENQGLNGMKWLIPKYLLEGKEGKQFIRLTRIRNNFVPRVVYFLNGEEVEKTVVEPFCLASEFSEREPSDCFNYNLDYILDVR